MTPLEYVQQRKIVAIVRGLKPEYIVRLGHAFEEGGIGLMEVPYDQKAPETWKNTAAAIEAVEKEAANGAHRVTDQSQADKVYAEEESYDFKGMMDEFQELIGTLVQKSPNMPAKITAIVDKHLGKGKKVGDCTEANAPQLDLILYDLRELNK